ncbi:hypothetical protein SANA_00760 [Gottschalkiaceae bacterium SANA]|nr:hypothetical protein SANA_00760 [Gottschalkiaceae bacterium SANA]
MKRIILVMLISIMVMTGCQGQTAVEEKKRSLEESVVASELSGQTDTTEGGQETLLPWSLEEYIGDAVTELTDLQREEAEKALNRINDAESGAEKGVEIETLYQELDQLLRSFGLRVPIDSFKTLTKVKPEAFTESQKEKLIDLEKQIQILEQDDPESEALKELNLLIEELLRSCGFDPTDVMDEIQMHSITLAKFTFERGKIGFVGDTEQIEESEMEKYRFLVNRAKIVIPRDQYHLLKYFLVNTDGKDEVLAYVSQENEESNKWRMVLDCNDAFDDKGKYIQEYDETIVHEFGHLLSLNENQMQEKITGTYENEDGILAEKSYLNEFFQTFWIDVYQEHQLQVDPQDQSGDSAYVFYEKHQDLFVSDYAATNPEEDFAETFRVFICKEKPSGEQKQDQKVLWMYKQEELVTMREQIRQRLNK